MGIKVEFNPDLALRNINEFKAGRRKRAECIPAKLQEGKIYPFLKREQRNYWFYGEIPLRETKGQQRLSRPLASVKILEATHFISQGEVWTKGKYKVIDIFHDDQVHFESLDRINIK